jgi:hypothetical protein
VCTAGRRRNAQAAFTAADEDMGLDDSSPMAPLERPSVASVVSVVGVTAGFRVMMSCGALFYAREVPTSTTFPRPRRL